MNQEKIMKRRMIRAIVLFIFTFIAMLVFIGLYIDETKRTQETYVAQYKDNLMHVSEDITSYLAQSEQVPSVKRRTWQRSKPARSIRASMSRPWGTAAMLRGR